VWYATFASLEVWPPLNNYLLKVDGNLDFKTGLMEQVDVTAQAKSLKEHRDEFGAIVGELLAKAYHVLPIQPTVPEIFAKTDASVINEPMQIDPIVQAAWAKIWTAASVLHHSLLASRDPHVARGRRHERQQAFARWRPTPQEDGVKNPYPYYFPMISLL